MGAVPTPRAQPLAQLPVGAAH